MKRIVGWCKLLFALLCIVGFFSALLYMFPPDLSEQERRNMAFITSRFRALWNAVRPSPTWKLDRELAQVRRHRDELRTRRDAVDRASAELAPRAQRRIDELRTLVPPTRSRAEAARDTRVRVALEVLKEILSRQRALQALRPQIETADIELAGLQEKIEVRRETYASLSEDALTTFRAEVERALASYVDASSQPLDRLPAPRVTDEDVWNMIR